MYNKWKQIEYKKIIKASVSFLRKQAKQWNKESKWIELKSKRDKFFKE